MNILGRKREKLLLGECLNSDKPEFIVVYGRRRVGKTYLIKEFFNNSFSFYATAVAEGKTREQLRAFNDALVEYGCEKEDIPKDWMEAFSRLKELLKREQIRRDPVTGKRVVFLDELPWMSTARSNFKSALDYFWNSWASTQTDIVLIVCGSATSWIIDNIVHDVGGLYNRISRQIHLMPFTLGECEEYFSTNSINLSRNQMVESYMVFGGIPYYMSLFDSRLSLAQNIEELCFKETGQLKYEYQMLFRSLFKNPNKHIAIIQALAKKRKGMSRVELAANKTIGDGEPLTKALTDLEQCGFIRRYKNYLTHKQGFLFQIIDPFVLFSMNFLENEKTESWLTYIDTPSYYAWSGLAYEMVCLNHINQIKSALGISGISSADYAWVSRGTKPGAQIDLLIDRKDGIINICEMKHTANDFVINDSFSREMKNKLEVFRAESGTKKALHITLISDNEVKGNERYGIVQNIITSHELFV